MKLIKLVILLLILVQVSYANFERPVVPYIDTEGNFYMNFTGQITEGEPVTAFTCTADSLSLDSLASVYPCVNVMDSVIFYWFIEMKMEEE